MSEGRLLGQGSVTVALVEDEASNSLCLLCGPVLREQGQGFLGETNVPHSFPLFTIWLIVLGNNGLIQSHAPGSHCFPQVRGQTRNAYSLV